MDRCCQTGEDKKNGEPEIGTTKQEYDQKTGHTHGGCCGCNPWIMVAMLILFIILILYFISR